MAEEVKLFGTWSSSFSRKVEIALNIKGVQYEYKEEDLKNKSTQLLKYNPIHKKIPVLVHNGKPIAESLVIVRYIDETWTDNPILPKDPYERATASFWAKFIEEKITPPIRKAFIGEETERIKAWEEASQGLKTLEDVLKAKGTKFFGGETIGLVDIEAIGLAVWTPALQQVSSKGLFTKENFPLLSVWSTELLNCSVVRDNLPTKDKLVQLYRARIQASANAAK